MVGMMRYEVKCYICIPLKHETTAWIKASVGEMETTLQVTRFQAAHIVRTLAEFAGLRVVEKGNGK